MNKKPTPPASPGIHGCPEPKPMSVVVADPSCFSLPYDYSLCKALSEAGCEVTLARSRFLYDQWDLAGPFATWDRFYQFTHGLGRKHARRWAWKLAKGAEHIVSMGRFSAELGKARPDVIHFQWLPLPSLDRLFLPRLSRIAPLILTLHNTKFSRFGLNTRLQQETGIRSAFRHLHALIVHSEFSKHKVVERGWMPEEKVYIVPHGPLDYYRTLSPQPPRSSTGEQIVLFFGTIEPYKGLDLLLRAFAALPLEIRQTARLHIAGKPGHGVQELLALSKSLGIETKVTWDLRFVAEKEVPSIFQSATIVALPYREIDQSGVLMTAIAFDKPVIATRVGGIPETIQDRVHGRLVQPGDTQQLTDALRDLLSDPEGRRNMEEAVHKLRTGVLSWNHNAERTLQVYRKVRCANLWAAVSDPAQPASSHKAPSSTTATS